MESVILDLNSTSFNFKCYLLSWSSPEGNCDRSAQEGPLDGLSILYTWAKNLRQKRGGDLERTGILKRIPIFRKMTSSYFHLKKAGGLSMRQTMCLTNQNWDIKIRIVDRLFWNLENLYCLSSAQRTAQRTELKGSFDFPYFLVCWQARCTFSKNSVKSRQRFFYEFKILFEVSGGGWPFSKLPSVRGFLNLW